MYQGKTVTGVIQARLGAEKMAEGPLMSLADRPVLRHVGERLGAVGPVDRIVLATSCESRDDPLVNYAHQLEAPNIEVFRGPSDVLERMYLVTQQWPTDLVVRVDGHAPLVSPSYLEGAVAEVVDRRLDAACADAERTGLTRGMGGDVFHHQAIVDAHLLAADPEDRCEVGRFICRNDRAFRVDHPSPAPELCSDFRLTMEYIEDYRLLAAVYRRLYRPGRIVDGRRALEWLRNHPEAAGLNAHHAPEVS